MADPQVYLITSNGVPKYIGLSRKARRRLHSHRCNIKDFQLQQEILMTCESKEEGLFWEAHYISLYSSWGFDLWNKSLYDNTMYGKNNHFYGKKHTPETRAKMSKDTSITNIKRYKSSLARAVQSKASFKGWETRRANQMKGGKQLLRTP